MWFLIPIAFVAAWILIPSKEGKGTDETLANSGVDVGSGDSRTGDRGENPTPQKADGLTKENPPQKPIEVNREEFLKAEKGVVTAVEKPEEKKESKNAADIGSPTTES